MISPRRFCTRQRQTWFYFPDPNERKNQNHLVSETIMRVVAFPSSPARA
jgi:hypothetical protein